MDFHIRWLPMNDVSHHWRVRQYLAHVETCCSSNQFVAREKHQTTRPLAAILCWRTFDDESNADCRVLLWHIFLNLAHNFDHSNVKAYSIFALRCCNAQSEYLRQWWIDLVSSKLSNNFPFWIWYNQESIVLRLCLGWRYCLALGQINQLKHLYLYLSTDGQFVRCGYLNQGQLMGYFYTPLVWRQTPFCCFSANCIWISICYWRQSFECIEGLLSSDDWIALEHLHRGCMQQQPLAYQSWWIDINPSHYQHVNCAKCQLHCWKHSTRVSTRFDDRFSPLWARDYFHSEQCLTKHNQAHDYRHSFYRFLGPWYRFHCQTTWWVNSIGSVHCCCSLRWELFFQTDRQWLTGFWIPISQVLLDCLQYIAVLQLLLQLEYCQRHSHRYWVRGLVPTAGFPKQSDYIQFQYDCQTSHVWWALPSHSLSRGCSPH